jgi:hypothetical protein
MDRLPHQVVKEEKHPLRFPPLTPISHPPPPPREDTTDTSAPERPSGQHQTGSDFDDPSPPIETPDQRYERFKASNGTDYDPRNPKHPNGTPFTAHEVEKETEGFQSRFETSPGSLNPNTVLPTRRSVLSEINKIRDSTLAYRQSHPSHDLYANYQSNSLGLHHALEGTHDAIGMKRSIRISSARQLYINVEAYAAAITALGGTVPPVHYD